MANYLAMNREELAAEKAALEAEYKKFQAKGLKLNMARGKPGPHQMDLAMDLLKMNDYTTDAGTDARNYGELEGLQEARVLFADVFGVQPGEVFVTADGTETAVTSRKTLDKSCTLTPKLFFQAAAQLGAMNADPIGDSYIAIIHPYAAYDLKTCKEFIEVHKYADPDTMFRGEIGKLGNIRFIETSEAKIWKDETCPTGLAVFGTLVLGAHAYGVTELEGGGLEHIVKQLGYGDDPLNQRASVGWKGMRAAERLVEQYMVRIESVSSYSANAAAN